MKKSIPQILKTNLDDIKLKSLETKALVVFKNTGWHFILRRWIRRACCGFSSELYECSYHTKIPIQL